MADVINTDIDKNARLALAWGRHPVQGYRIKHRVEMVGNDKQVFVKLGLGLDEWDACEGLYCGGVQIAPTNFVFHPGGPVDTPDDFFPGETNPGATYVNVRLTGLMADEKNIDKIEGIYRTLKIANYDGAGVQVDVHGNPIPGGATPRNYFFYSPSPPREMTDLIIRWGLRNATMVNWPGWADWRDDCAELIPWTGGFVGVQPGALVWRAGGNMTAGAGGAISKSGGANGVWDAGTVTDNYIPISANGYLRWTAGAGRYMCGLTPQQSLVQPTYTGILLALYMETGGLLKLYSNGTNLSPGNGNIGTWVNGDVFEVGVSGGAWVLKKNGNALSTGLTLPPVPSEQLHGAIAAMNSASSVTAATFSPLAGGDVSETRMVPRFESHLFLMPPFRLSSDGMDKIAEVCCAQWQRGNGKLYFLTPHARDPIFTFDLTQLPVGAFKTYPKDRRDRYNQVIVYGRDLDTKFLTPFGNEGAAPLIDIKRDLAPNELRKPYEIQAGGMTASQASRVGEFYARLKCDDPQYAEIEGSPKSYPVLPVDVIALSDVVPTWNGVKFVVVEKEESEDTKLGYPMTLELYKPNAYSDTEHGPVERPLPVTNPDSFAAPPHVTAVTLSESNETEADHTVVTVLRVEAQFVSYVNQDKGYKGRVFYKESTQADNLYKDAGVIVPDPTTLQGALPIRGVKKVTYNVKVVPESPVNSAGIAGATPYNWTIQGKTTPPALPTGLSATLGDNGMIVFSVNPSTDGDFSYMRVYDGTGAIVRSRVDATQWEEPPSAASVTRKVTFFNRSGNESAFSTPLTYTLPNPLLPSGYGLSFDGENSRLLHRLTAVADVTYDFARANDGTNIIAQDISGGVFDETSIPNTSRGTFTRYARARRFGMVSAWIAASPALTVIAPVAPTISEIGGDASRATPVSFPLKITTTTPKSQIKTTVIQLRLAGGSWPVSTAQGTANVIRRNGAPEEATVEWNAGGAIEVRVAHEDIFTPQIGDHVWSTLLAHTFPKFNDGALDPNSNFLKKAAGRNGIIDGAGTIGWTSAFVVKWSLPIVITSGLSPTRAITIAANVSGQALSQGHRLVARYNIGDTTATVTDVTLSTYTEPDELTGVIDFPLFERRSGSNILLTYLGQPLDPDRYLDSSVLIPRLVSFIADLKSVLIDDANINSLSAAKILVDVLYGRIVFADYIGSKNFVTHGSQTAQSETVQWQGAMNASISVDGYTLTKTGIAGFNAGAVSTRSIHKGDGYCEFVIPSGSGLNFMVGLSYGDTDQNYTDIDHAWYVVDTVGLKIYESGIDRGVFSVSYAAGDTLRVALEGTTIKYYRKASGASIFTLMHTSVVTPKLPLLVDVSMYPVGFTLPAVTINGVLAPTTGVKLQWKNIVKVSLDASDDLTSTGTGLWGASGCASKQGLDTGQAGRVQFTTGETNKGKMLGLSTTDADQNYTSIQRAWHPAEDGNAYIYESGVAAGGSYGAYTTSTVFDISREGGQIVYRMDGVVKRATTDPSTNSALYIDTALKQSGATLKNVRLFEAGAKGQGWQADPNGAIEAQNLKVGPTTLNAIRVRATGAINDNLQFTGRDFDIPSVHKLNSTMFKLGNVRAVDEDAYTELIVDIPDSVLIDEYANFDSVKRVRVKLYNVFGDVVGDIETGFDRRGKVVIGFHDRSLADPAEHGVFSIEFFNAFGISKPIYWAAGAISAWNSYWNWTTVQNGTTTAPTWRKRTDFPSNLTATAVSDTEIQLTWKASTTNQSGLSNFGVYRRLYTPRGIKPAFALVTLLSQATESYKITNLSPNTKYELISHGGGGAEWSNFAIAQTYPAPVAAAANLAPSGLAATPTGQTTATLNWTRVATTNTGVEVYRDGVLVATLGAAVITWGDTGRTAGTRYVYKVRNVFAGPTYSGYSNEDDATTFANPAPIAADPTNLQAVLAADGKTINLTWTANSGSNATVYRSLDGGATWSSIATGQTSSYTDSATLYETHYYYRVFNVTGGTGYSNNADIWTERLYLEDPDRGYRFD